MDDDTPRECSFCDRAWGLVGLATALIIGAVGLDLLLGGAITRAMTRTAERLEAASDSGT
jgi:hypothetical protein